jgi:hypothetical protein
VAPLLKVGVHVGLAVVAGEEDGQLVVVPQLGDGVGNDVVGSNAGGVVGGTESGDVLAVAASTGGPVYTLAKERSKKERENLQVVTVLAAIGDGESIALHGGVIRQSRSRVVETMNIVVVEDDALPVSAAGNRSVGVGRRSLGCSSCSSRGGGLGRGGDLSSLDVVSHAQIGRMKVRDEMLRGSSLLSLRSHSEIVDP